ncbi:DNA replication complex GINS family protein [Candidatus Micrarchaeota archaeon]|nr:DNA replication complex GINS family protein [Candidatus Micrarchaeota archaeon]
MAEISFDELRKVQLLEKKSASLAPLPETFFADCRDWMARQEESLKNGFSLEGARVRDNASRVLEEIVSLRQQKILLKALRDIRAGEVSSDGLAQEEKQLYTAAVKLLKEFECSLAGRAVAPEGSGVNCEPLPDGFLSVRILADIPEAFVGSDGKEYGPYSASQVVRLARDQALSLVRRKVAEEISEAETAKMDERERVALLARGETTH